MQFWDSSAIVPILLPEPRSERVRAVARADDRMIVWWGSMIECSSAVARYEREDGFTSAEADRARVRLKSLAASWLEVAPSEECRERAMLLVRRHPLSAADALQLAAALVWTGGRPRDVALCTLDDRLAAAARSEGFTLQLAD